METKKGNLGWKVLLIAMSAIIVLGLGKPATDNVKDLLGKNESQVEESVESSPAESEENVESTVEGDGHQGGVTTNETFTFEIQFVGPGIETKTYTAVKGMTFGEWIESDYNVDSFTICEKGYVCFGKINTFEHKELSGYQGEGFCTSSTVIAESGLYNCGSVNYGEGGGAN